jgi:sugar-phosphatase
VYIDCADALQVSPVTCLAFEDSFNGMIAAKAARMKCVVIPSAADSHHIKWNAADTKLNSLTEISKDLFTRI